MRNALAMLGVIICTLLHSRESRAICAGDCGGDGEVTVNELILGVNIALGNASLDECASFDTDGSGDVTVNELIAAVNSALNSCPAGNFAGDYTATVVFDATHSGIVSLSAGTDGQVDGSIVVSGPTSSAVRFRPAFTFTFPVGGVSVSLSGTYDPVSGGFDVEGSFVDANGQTIPVVISGDFPGATGSTPINVYVGSDPPFAATLSAGTNPTPTPTVPPGNGPRIVFAEGAPSHISVINLDGSGKSQIHSSIGNDSTPAWSPDGTKIAFTTPDDINDHLTIGVMNADGGGFHRLAEAEAFYDGNPAWSPNGAQIVLTAGGGDAIDVMNADGSNRHRLVTKTAGEGYGHLSWSPDGTRIAFESTRPRQIGSDDRFEIWVMNADGSNLVRLTTNEVADHHPAWRPDGAKIAFSTQPNVFTAKNIYLMNPDGTGVAQLTHDFLSGTAPAWSHDGQKIAFASFMGITVANADGSSPAAVPGTQFISDFDLK